MSDKEYNEEQIHLWLANDWGLYSFCQRLIDDYDNVDDMVDDFMELYGNKTVPYSEIKYEADAVRSYLEMEIAERELWESQVRDAEREEV